ncbi:MAG: DSD1 family PLP-dependent enzyme [Candidatus Bathyarchaeia archaeon]
MKVQEYDTPALVLDIEAAERNIKRMGEYFRGKKVHLRPHVKVHKSPFLAHKQIAAGAPGITCAKLSEAEVMANSGIEDILIANQIVGPYKIRRLVNLSRYCKLRVLVDDIGNAIEISKFATEAGSKIGVLIEVNLFRNLEGILDRCGVRPGQPAVDLTHKIADLNGLEFKGLMGYEGSLRKFTTPESRINAVEQALGPLIETKRQIEKSGLPVEDVSCGGTMSYDLASRVEGVTEVEAGSYVFMDTTYNKYGIDFEYALTILTGVVSRPRREKVIVDAGLKTISGEHGLPPIKGRGDMECMGLNAEHGHYRLSRPSDSPHSGDKLEMLPTHVDTTVCLHDNYIIARKGEVEGTLRIEGRGKLQ